MRIAQIDECEIVNGNGVGVSLYIQGCPIHCDGCFNPETGDFNGGKEWLLEDEETVHKFLKPNYIHRLSIVGGEPLYYKNIFDLFLLVSSIKYLYPEKEIGLGTGYTGDQIQKRIIEAKAVWPSFCEDNYLYGLLCQIDYIIAGPFEKDKKDLTLRGRGSSNQEVIDMQQTLQNHRKILYV